MNPLFKPNHREDDLPQLLGRAEQGIVSAQFEAAKILHEQKLPSAITWFAAATAQGHVQARLCLGFCHLYGKGVEANTARALDFFEAGVTANDPEAMAILAFFCLECSVTPKDEPRALELARRCAGLGHPDGAYLLARMRLEGRGLPLDPEGGREQMRDAAELGSARARAYLGEWHLNGDHAARNPRLAFDHLNHAAQRGVVHAMRPLARCYEYGIGTVADYDKACHWLMHAREHGDELAHAALRDLDHRSGMRNLWKVISGFVFVTHFLFHGYATTEARKAVYVFAHGLLGAAALGGFLLEPLLRSFRARGLKWTVTVPEALAFVVSLTASFGVFTQLTRWSKDDPRAFAALAALVIAQATGAAFAYLHRRVASDDERPGYAPVGLVAVVTGSLAGFAAGLGSLYFASWFLHGTLL